jgi:hypothetical protein
MKRKIGFGIFVGIALWCAGNLGSVGSAASADPETVVVFMGAQPCGYIISERTNELASVSFDNSRAIQDIAVTNAEIAATAIAGSAFPIWMEIRDDTDAVLAASVGVPATNGIVKYSFPQFVVKRGKIRSISWYGRFAPNAPFGSKFEFMLAANCRFAAVGLSFNNEIAFSVKPSYPGSHVLILNDGSKMTETINRMASGSSPIVRVLGEGLAVRTLEWSTDLAHWQTLASSNVAVANIEGVPTFLDFRMPTNFQRMFYRSKLATNNVSGIAP